MQYLLAVAADIGDLAFWKPLLRISIRNHVVWVFVFS